MNKSTQRYGFRGQMAILALAMWALSAPAAMAQGDQATTPTLKVIVTIEPQAGCVEAIGGERVEVQFLVGPGQSPHTYQPTMRQLLDLKGARAWLRIGVPFEEALVPKLKDMIEGLRVVDTRQGITLLPIEAHQEGEDEAEAAHAGHDADHTEHDHEGMDPHIWLDPMRLKRQAQTVCETLSGLDPVGRTFYEARYRTYAERLDRVHARLTEALAPLKGRELFVYHPAFGYLAQAYGLHQVAVETGGKEPTPRHLALLSRRAREAGVKVIFVQPQMSDKSAKAMAKSIGATVVALDPLAHDIPANLERIARQIRAAMGPPPELTPQEAP